MLVQKARQGDQEALLRLWQGVSRLAYKVAMRYKDAALLNGAVDVDDLKQCAFLGFYDAVNTYEPDKGDFLPHMGMRIKATCRKTLGLTGRNRREHFDAISMETPLAENLTLADTLPDPSAAEILYQTELKADVDAALHRLPGSTEKLIRLHDLQGVPLIEAATVEGHSFDVAQKMRRDGLRQMRNDRSIRDYNKDIRLKYKGLRAYKSDWTSVVEDEVIRRLDK